MRLVPIGEICALRNGRSFKPTEWSSSGTPIIRIQNLTDEDKPFNYCAFEVDSRFHVDTGNLLFSWSGTPGTSFGAFFWKRGRGYLNQHIFRIDPYNPENLHLEYFRLALNSKLDEIIGHAHGGVGLQHITKEKLNKIEVFLPDYDDQIRIAHLLTKVEGLITQRKQHLQQLDDLLKSVFMEMFGDPVRNEKGWETAPLEKLGSVNRGVSKHRPRNDPKLLGGIHPLIQTGEVSNAGTYITSYRQTYSDIGFAQSKQWPVGTLCITIAANIAQTSILTFKACFPDSVVGFIADTNEANPLYVHGLFWFFQSILEKNAPAAAQKNINLEILRSLVVPKPPIHLQKQFATRVEKVEALKSRYQQNLNDLESLYGALSQQAFKGELDLSQVPLLAESEEKRIETSNDVKISIPLSDFFRYPDISTIDIKTTEGRKTFLTQMLSSWLEQFTHKPFSPTDFMRSVQNKLWGLTDGELHLNKDDYDQIKNRVFEALKAEKLEQTYDGNKNRIQLNPRSANGKLA